MHCIPERRWARIVSSKRRKRRSRYGRMSEARHRKACRTGVGTPAGTHPHIGSVKASAHIERADLTAMRKNASAGPAVHLACEMSTFTI